MPGHGGEPFKCKDAFLKELASLPPQHVVAYSMGARLALEALFYYKAPFLSLTCLSTTLEIKSISARKELEEQWMKSLSELPTKAFIDTWYRQEIFKTFTPPKRRYFQNKKDIHQVLSEYSILKSPSFIENIQKTKTPLHFIYRRKDPKAIPLKDYPNIHYVNNSSHSIHLENKDSILSILDNILSI